jgi:hypothetical protein
MPKLLPETEWPAYQVKALRIEDLKVYDRNARTHSAEQIDEIAASIEEFGWTNPALIDENRMIVAGHGRRLAALKIYEAGGTIRLPDGRDLPQGMIPTIDCAGWSEDQKRAYVLADNQLALNAGWDLDVLRSELQLLNAGGFELSLVGFSAEKLDHILLDPAVANQVKADQARQSLKEKFGVVPFSVFRASEGWWQDRKRSWLDLGIESEVGRGENALGFSESMISASNGGDPYNKKNHPAVPGGGKSRATGAAADAGYMRNKKKAAAI